MRIAIDLNEVLRDFLKQFSKFYKLGYDHTFDMDNFEEFSNNPEILFNFKSKRAFEQFTYMDYPYELFGCAPSMDRELPGLFNEWLHNIEGLEQKVELIIVSPMEHGISIPSTLFFLAKFGSKIREIYFPTDSANIWDKCDVLITANPLLLDTKPEGKITVKISQNYNTNSKGDLEYSSMRKFLKDENNIQKLFEKDGKE